MNEQSELNFDAGGDSSGLTRWREVRRAASQALAQRLGLPLGYRVEVWLCGDIRLRGQLRLEEELLFLDAGAQEQEFFLQTQNSCTWTPAHLRRCGSRWTESCLRPLKSSPVCGWTEGRGGEEGLTARNRLVTPVRVTSTLNLNLLLTNALRLGGAAVRV